jgi:hypothetical protein
MPSKNCVGPEQRRDDSRDLWERPALRRLAAHKAETKPSFGNDGGGGGGGTAHHSGKL